MKNKDRYNLSELTISKDSLFGVPILRVYQGRDLKTRKEIATIRRYGDKRVDSILDWLEQDYSPLDEKEKEYLSAVIKPFRNRVIFIRKTYLESMGEERIEIVIEVNNCFHHYMMLPPFEKGTMYQGMELDKEYTIEDLGL